jgi:hypothetical protein
MKESYWDIYEEAKFFYHKRSDIRNNCIAELSEEAFGNLYALGKGIPTLCDRLDWVK